MFNEAFWFFYVLGVVESIAIFLFVVGLLITGVTILVGGPIYLDSYDKEKPAIIKNLCKSATVAFVCFLICIFLPTKTAMMAGAGQYVAEETQTIQTLKDLKAIVDKKIAEELADEKDE